MVSCIIPAYKEGPRIRGVLSAVYKHPLVNEIIVVDDGSNDNTEEVVKKFSGVRFIKHKHNKGKSQAVVTGINQARGDFLFFLDADLINLAPENITALIEPIISGSADIAISLRINAPWIFRAIGIDFISGERVFTRKLVVEHLNDIERLASYGLESYLNKLIIRNRYRIKIVFWKNVLSPWPQEKRGRAAGWKTFLFMLSNIFKTISPLEACYQIFKMRSLRV